MTGSYEEIKFEKEIDVDIDADIDLDVEIKFEKDVDIDIDVKSDVDIEDNLTHVVVEAEAIGDNSLVEIDTVVLTTDYMSSAYLDVIAAVD